MLNLMDRYSIIKLKLKGKSNCEAAKELGIDRKTLAKYWNEYRKAVNDLAQTDGAQDDIRLIQERIIEAPQYDTSKRCPVKYTEKLDAYVDKILDDEEEKNRKPGSTHKQHLTNVQIHELVIEAGFDVGRSTLNVYLKIERKAQGGSYEEHAPCNTVIVRLKNSGYMRENQQLFGLFTSIKEWIHLNS